MSRADRDGARLGGRLEQLAEVADAARGRLSSTLGAGLDGALGRARDRLGHGTANTVVAVAGATGSGKSSLVNALSGADVAAVGVRRPTTSRTQAAVFDAAGALGPEVSGLLDWLEVDRREVVGGERGRDLAGLVLLDLPDHDSTSLEHRAEVDRLVEVVDAFVWVVDPQKYADLSLHEGYLRRYAGHGAVTIVALNQVDLVPEAARRALLDDLRALLRDDGLHDVRTLATSARTGDGIPELGRELAARVAERRAAVARLDADVDQLAELLWAEVGDVDPRPVTDAARRRLHRACATAAGAEAVADAVGAAHRRRAAQLVGWPPTRWLGRLRADPLRRLGLERPAPAEGTTTVGRTSRPAQSAVAEAAISTATRELVDPTVEGLPEPWRRRVAEAATRRRGDLADALDHAIASAQLPTARPAWWSAVSAVQWLLAGVMVLGLVWLVVIGVVAWLRLPDLPTPELGEIPWPTALAVGGALAGLLVSVVARAAAGVGARRRARVALRRLEAAAATTSDELVVDPVDEELRALAELRRRVLALRR